MNSVEGKGIEMIRTDQCEYVQQLSYELLLKVLNLPEKKRMFPRKYIEER